MGPVSPHLALYARFLFAIACVLGLWGAMAWGEDFAPLRGGTWKEALPPALALVGGGVIIAVAGHNALALIRTDSDFPTLDMETTTTFAVALFLLAVGVYFWYALPGPPSPDEPKGPRSGSEERGAQEIPDDLRYAHTLREDGVETVSDLGRKESLTSIFQIGETRAEEVAEDLTGRGIARREGDVLRLPDGEEVEVT